MMFRGTSRNAIGLIAAVLLVSVCSIRAAAYSGVVEGVVKDSSGRLVSGAFVKLKNAERRLTFMVISQTQDRHTANKLPPGKYSLQGVGNGFQSEWSALVDVTEGKATKLDLSLTAPHAPMLPAAWPRRIPEEEAATLSLPEGADKQIVSTRCGSCHELSRAVRSRYDRDTWQTTIHEMREYMKTGGLSDLTDKEARVVLDYVATNFPPLPTPDPNSRLPRTLLQGEATKYRVVQYELENTAAETHDIAVDPDGWAGRTSAPAAS